MAEKKNYWTQAIGTQDAIIQFGGVSSEKDVRSSFKVVALDGNHFFTMDQDGQRKGWSTLYSPGAVQVGAGLDLKEDDNAIFVDALNGDIIIKAENARIKLEGDEIDLKAKKSIVIEADNTVEIESNDVSIHAKSIMGISANCLLELNCPSVDIMCKFLRGVSVATLGKTNSRAGRQD